MSKGWEELISRLEFTNLPDWNHKIILEKMFDPTEATSSKAIVSEAANPKIALAMEVTPSIPMVPRLPRPKPSIAKEKQRKPQAVPVR